MLFSHSHVLLFFFSYLASNILLFFLFFFGGFPFIWAYDKNWPTYAIYCWVYAVLLFLFFWPVKYLGVLLIIVQNFYVNAVALVGLGIYPCLDLPSLLGGICSILSGLMFLAAAISGEKGKSIDDLRKKD